MRFLFASGGSFVPEIFGGAECSIAELAREVGARGHTCAVVAGTYGRRRRLLRRVAWLLARGRPAPDQRAGVATYRTAPRRVPTLVADRIVAERPDLVVAWNARCVDIAGAARAAGVPALVWVPDVTFARYIERLPPVTLAGCSRFVAGRLRERTGVAARLLRPVIRLDEYRAAERRPEHVTLVNPHPNKGLEVALGVAALLGHRRFVIVDSSTFGRAERRRLRARLARLPNVTLVAPVPRLRTIYARTALLLAPSQVEDASPRVVLEAQINGIPVVASAVGGIPEIMGDGGVLVPPLAPPAVWAEAVEAILASPARAAELGALGRANAARPELGPAQVTDDFLALAGELVRA